MLVCMPAAEGVGREGALEVVVVVEAPPRALGIVARVGSLVLQLVLRCIHLKPDLPRDMVERVHPCERVCACVCVRVVKFRATNLRCGGGVDLVHHVRSEYVLEVVNCFLILAQLHSTKHGTIKPYEHTRRNTQTHTYLSVGTGSAEHRFEVITLQFECMGAVLYCILVLLECALRRSTVAV